MLCFFRGFWVNKSRHVTLQGAHLSTKNACTTWHHLSNLQQARVVQKQNKVWSDQKAATRQVFRKILDKLVKCMNWRQGATPEWIFQMKLCLKSADSPLSRRTFFTSSSAPNQRGWSVLTQRSDHQASRDEQLCFVWMADTVQILNPKKGDLFVDSWLHWLSLSNKP